jgi:uncharacterized protein (DUF1778 family)
MEAETQTTDAKGRVSLPKGFANSTVTIERVSDSEVRIRKAVVIAEDEVRFSEQSATPLSDRDRDAFLSLLDSPPAPNEALRAAAARQKKRHG